MRHYRRNGQKLRTSNRSEKTHRRKAKKSQHKPRCTSRRQDKRHKRSIRRRSNQHSRSCWQTRSDGANPQNPSSITQTLILPTSFSTAGEKTFHMPRTTPPWEIKRELQIKNEDTTNPKYGHEPEHRPPQDYIRYGVINLDKPAGPTSHEVAAWTKKILKIACIGHGGTLEA